MVYGAFVAAEHVFDILPEHLGAGPTGGAQTVMKLGGLLVQIGGFDPCGIHALVTCVHRGSYLRSSTTPDWEGKA